MQQHRETNREGLCHWFSWYSFTCLRTSNLSILWRNSPRQCSISCRLFIRFSRINWFINHRDKSTFLILKNFWKHWFLISKKCQLKLPCSLMEGREGLLKRENSYHLPLFLTYCRQIFLSKSIRTYWSKLFW